MERLFKRENIHVPCSVTYEAKVRLKRKTIRVDGLTQDLSVEGARVAAYAEVKVQRRQIILFSVGRGNDAQAIVRAVEPAGANTILRLEFLEASQAFLSAIVPIIKSEGVSNAAITDWSAA